MATAVQNERDKIIRRNPAAAAGAKAARSASTSSFGSPAESKSLGGGGPGGGQGGGTPTWTQGGGGSSPYPSPSHAAPHTPTNGGSGVPLPIPAPTLAELLSTLNASHEVCMLVCTAYAIREGDRSQMRARPLPGPHKEPSSAAPSEMSSRAVAYVRCIGTRY